MFLILAVVKPLGYIMLTSHLNHQVRSNIRKFFHCRSAPDDKQVKVILISREIKDFLKHLICNFS